ncbi:hypothetical protein D3C77_296480 [compost metagenome]
MFALSLDLQQFIRRIRHGRINIRPARAWNAIDLGDNIILLIPELRRLYDPPWPVVKGDNAYRILGSQHFDRTYRRFLGQPDIVPCHAAGSVDDENEPKRRDLPLALQLHRYRKELLDRRFEITAHAKTLFSTDHHEADAIGTNRLLDELHLLASDLFAGYIVKDDAVIAGVFRHFRRQQARFDDRILNQARFQCIFQIRGRSRLSLDDQYLWTASNAGKSIIGIVCCLLVPVHEYFCPVAMKPWFSGQAL